MKFDYQFFEGRFLPIVPIRLKGKTEWLESRAYVDTGASYCLFHADVAEILGIKLEEGERNEMTLGDGNILKVYLHKLLVSIAGKKFVALIGFSKGIGIGFYIVGRKDIFDNFIVCFNEKEKQIEFKPTH
jgi:predicted aspartyl protease